MKRIPNFLVWVLPITSIIVLSLTMPFGTSYYAMKTDLWRLLYITLIYGIPVWVIIPISIIASIFSIITLRKLKFKERIIKISKSIFLGVNIILLLINSALAFSKFVLENNPFPRVKYASLNGTNKNLSKIKEGEFKTSYARIIRSGNNHRVEYNNGEISNYYINWLDNGEHQLIYIDEDNLLNDTLTVLVTLINEDYYECYYKLGELAQPDKIEIKK
tara:strand:+ start:211 stop:864 length:654 start_codon:yes stop_codon:yes gene_type:complete